MKRSVTAFDDTVPKRNMRKILVVPEKYGAIDEQDYLVIASESEPLPMVTTDKQYDEQRRICELDCSFRSYPTTPLPNSIGRLANLTRLDASDACNSFLPISITELVNLEILKMWKSKITSLPPSIGRLANQTRLDVLYTRITFLPDAIGELVNLRYLNVSGTEIAALPPSIGQLKHLRKLYLCFMSRLMTIPAEIGDLASMNELWLFGSKKFEQLPRTLGKLKNLTHIRLSHTKAQSQLPEEMWTLTSLKLLDLGGPALLMLPEEVGNLCNLTELNVSGTNIKSLPASIGQLTNLECLNLYRTTNLGKLPEEIGNLGNLKELNLNGSGIASLPDSFGRLRRLMCLYISSTRIPELREQKDRYKFLLMLAKKCQSLGFFGYGLQNEIQGNEIGHALACNRARFRTGFGAAREKGMVQLQLWPRMLSRAPRAFEKYYSYHDLCDAIGSVDAIHQLLADGRESFVWILLDRNTTKP